MQTSPKIDKPKPPIPSLLHRKFEAVRFSEKLKPLRNRLFQNRYQAYGSDVWILTHEAKTFQTHQIHWIPYYLKEHLLFPLSQPYKEQKLEKFHGPDESDMVPNDLHTPFDISESDEIVFDDHPFCNDDNEQYLMVDNELYKIQNKKIITTITLNQNLILEF